jgi:hypothetical protein
MDVVPLVAAGRRMAVGTFVDVSTISDRAIVSDGHGGQTTTYVPRAAQISVSLVGVKDTPLADDMGVLKGTATVMVLCPWGTDLPDGARLTTSGVTYEVVGRRSAESNRTVMERYLAREVS